jgi:hypothetical protein
MPPIETVASGSIVEFDLLDASGGQLTEASTIADLAELDFARVDQVNGPIAVDGAKAGDVGQHTSLDNPAGIIRLSGRKIGADLSGRPQRAAGAAFQSVRHRQRTVRQPAHRDASRRVVGSARR